MLPKPKRLNSADFLNLNTKNVFRGFYVDISICSAQKTKFACIISKKKIKKAVDRNRTKRRVYSIIENLNLKDNYSVVIYPKPTALSGEYNLIKSEINEVFDKL